MTGPAGSGGTPAAGDSLHPVIRAAGAGEELPDWARLGEERLAHSRRVAELMERWAARTGLGESDRLRWSAAGLLHDALKDVSPEELEDLVPDPWPPSVLHGPACARRLADAGVDDPPLLLAIAHHSTGHPGFDRLGEALYMADYLEPGREGEVARRSKLRSRLPEEHDAVLRAVAAAKIGSLIRKRLPLPDVTVDFWNALSRPDGGP